MPLAVTHVLVPIILLELMRERYSKVSKYFSKKHLLLVGIAGLVPDLDVPLYTFTSIIGKANVTDVGHRIIFHNIWMPAGFLLFFFALRQFAKVSKGKRKRMAASFSKIFLVLFIGFSIHMVLDAVLTGYVMPFYPLNDYTVDLNLMGKFADMSGIPILTLAVSLDAILLIFWLWHEETEHYIKEYF